MEENLPPRRAVKRRRRRSRCIFGLWPRLFALGAFAVLVVVIAVALVGKIARPYRQIRAQTDEMQRLTAQIHSVQDDNTRLARRVAYLKTPDGVAAEARRYHYLRAGENFLVIAPAVSPAAPPAPAAVARPQSLPDRMRATWKRVTGKE